MRNLLILISFILFTNEVCAQNVRFTTDGVIEFEKRSNMLAIIKKQMGKETSNFMQQAYDAYKKNQPQFRVLKSTMVFSKDKTLYTPQEPDVAQGGHFFNSPLADQPNTTYTDLRAGLFTTKKISMKRPFW